MTTTMTEIEALAKVYADKCQELTTLVNELEAARAALMTQHGPRLRNLLAVKAGIEQQLRQDVDKARQLFSKPRTVVLHGIQVGLEKGKGKVTFSNPEKVVELIDKKLPELAGQLVITERKPSKTALAKLTVQQLKLLGATVEAAGDRVVVRAVGTDVDKLVLALLRGMADMTADEPASAEA